MGAEDWRIIITSPRYPKSRFVPVRWMVSKPEQLVLLLYFEDVQHGIQYLTSAGTSQRCRQIHQVRCHLYMNSQRRCDDPVEAETRGATDLTRFLSLTSPAELPVSLQKTSV